MSLEELFQAQQKMQQEGKKQGQHYPMYTKRKPTNGEQPSVDNMHEEATRDQLSHMYKQQNGNETTKESASDDRVAQNSISRAQQGRSTQSGVKSFLEGVGDTLTYGRKKREAVDSIYAQDADDGLLPAQFEKKHYKNFVEIHGKIKGREEYEKAERAYLKRYEELNQSKY